ncbi:hypothetical protein Hamer_G020378 [Homarus americanus]|uniref:Uncharacterized protein n=1 Tax=Homarus americanus TaxID=6706 RepID=A0A8J5JB23_HOMAM|nr:hypothetical protein Hamer_G020378 [Homarus americanus]
MRWKWWWMAVAIVSLLTVPSSTSANESLNALALEREVLDLLTPLIGDIGMALQGFIDIGKIGMGVAKFIGLISEQVFNASELEMNFGSYIPSADRKILAMFELLSRRLDQIEHGVHGIANSLRDLADGMQEMVRWEIALNTVEDHTLMDFANTVVSHDTHSVMSLMAHLHSMAAPESADHTTSSLHSGSRSYTVLNDPKDMYKVSERVTRKMILQEKMLRDSKGLPNKPESIFLRPSLFVMLHDVLEKSDRCSLNQSPQQLINGLFVLLSLTEARGYAMLEFSWMLLRVYNEGNFTVEQEVSERLFLQYSEDIMREAKAVLLHESREFYKCDPREHVEGETYVQITELMQGYIENEVDMNSGGSCSNNCGYYQHTKNEGCYMPQSQYCGQHRRCRGTIHDCQFYDADAWACLSRNPYRRYDYVRYENRHLLGPTQQCEGSEMKIDSWWRFFFHCSYCLCLCDDGESPTTDRYISLVPALSDTRNNKVVTGIQFIKQRRVIHLQVRQGQALPQGQVNSSTVEWVDVEPISIISTAYIEGIHYKKLSFENRSIDLDRLVSVGDHVVTGVRFRMLGSHINLEVQITPVNYTTGQLQPYKSYWISNDNTPAMARNPRRELKINSPDDPTKFPGLSKVDSVSDTFVRFGPTDRGKDVAQLTVPFFDAQTVSPSPSSWWSGLELFHKGQPGSGGFLGLKIISFNMTPHMEVKDNRSKTLDLPVIPAE